MSKLTEFYRTKGVCNDYEFADGAIFVSYTPSYLATGDTAKWQVIKGHEVTDLAAHWSDHGYKTFLVYGSDRHAQNKQAALDAAKQWASEKYGIKEWARTPFGSWMEADFVKRRMEELGKPGKDAQ